MARTVDLLALVRADWRRLTVWLLGGWSVFTVVLLLALVDLGCRDCPAGTVDRFTGLKVLLFCLFYAMAPWVFSVAARHHGTEILRHMPLNRRDINRFVLLRGLALGLACLPMWGVVLWVLPRFGFLVQPWMVVVAGLTILAYQLVGMIAGRLVAIAVPVVFPILIFPPHSHRLLSGPLEFATTPWAAAVLILLISAALPRALSRPLPRSGGRR